MLGGSMRIFWLAAFGSSLPIFRLEPAFLNNVVENLAIPETALCHENVEHVREILFLETMFSEQLLRNAEVAMTLGTRRSRIPWTKHVIETLEKAAGFDAFHDGG